MGCCWHHPFGCGFSHLGYLDSIGVHVISYCTAAPLLIHLSHLFHKIQLWKALMLFILHIVLSEWLAQLVNGMGIYIAVFCYSGLFIPMARPLYYEGLFG